MIKEIGPFIKLILCYFEYFSRTHKFIFKGIDPRLIEVECIVSPALPSFSIFGLPGKTVLETCEGIRAALNTMAIALSSKKITSNLTPADLPKNGLLFALAIAFSLLRTLEVIPTDYIDEAISF